MAAFVDFNEYLAYFDLAAADVNAARVVSDLNAACDTIRDYLCQTLDVVEDDVIVLFGTDTRALLLPELPVTVVTSITLDAEAVTDWTVDANGVLWRTDPAYWPRGEQYTVTYTHGYTAVPEVLKVVALQLVNNAATTGAGIRSEAIADYSVTYATDTGGASSLLSSLDRRVVKRVPTP